MLLTVMGTLEFLKPFNISLLRSAPYQNHCYVHSSNGAERNAFDSDGNIAISLAIQYFPAPLRSVPESLLRSQFQRSGAECFWQWWEHCSNFSSHSIFPLSAPLRSVPESPIHAAPSGSKAVQFRHFGIKWTHLKLRFKLALVLCYPLIRNNLRHKPMINKSSKDSQFGIET